MTKEAKILLGLAGLGAVVFVAAAVLLTPSAPPASQSSLVKADSIQTGPTEAKVTLVEFADFQCPACAAAAPIIDKLEADYKGKVNFVFRHFPLPAHANAMLASNGGELAAKDGKFWEFYRVAYENQTTWAQAADPGAKLAELAGQVGLEATKFKSEIGNFAYAGKIRADKSDGENLGVNSTPTFFINGQKYIGVQSYETLKNIFDSLLK